MKKHLLRWSLVSLCVLLVIWQALAQDGTPATTLDKLNVRGGPDSTYPVVGAVEINTSVTIVGRNRVGDRILIQAGDLRGWVASRYLSFDGVALADIPVNEEIVAGIPAETQAVSSEAPVDAAAPQPVVLEGTGTAATILTDKLNLRTGPGSNYAAIAQLPLNSSVLIEGRNSVGNWLLLNTTSGRGWVASRYVGWQVSETPLANLPVSGEVVGQAPAVAVAESSPADTGTVPVPTGSGGKVIAASLNMRISANRTATQVGSLARGTAVAVEGRNTVGDWLLVNTGSLRGWVSTRFIDFDEGVVLASLPVSGEIIGQAAPPAGAGDSAASSGPLAVSGDVAAMEAQLLAVPVVPVVTARSITLYQAALRAGRNAQRFTKIGDCNSENAAFMKGFDWNNYSLGSYGYLQGTVDYFAGSFAQDSVAGKVGYSAVTVIDSTWADPALCKNGEAPAYCEIRTSNAAFVVIMFGANDISVLTPERYESALRRILDLTIQGHSVPILSTFTTDPSQPDRWAKALQLNLITVNVAREYDLPVMNFWAAAKNLPAAGMSGDNAHLTTHSGSTIAFDGSENLYGFTMRDLVVLQALDAVRQGVGG